MVINKKMVVAAIALAMTQLPLSAANAQTANINIAVAANFATPLATIISDFEDYYAAQGYTYTVTVTSGASGTLENSIISAGTSNTYDLFLAADSAHPYDLYNNHSSLTTAIPFTYARGYLELISVGSSSTNITSSGLPTPSTLAANSVVIANPATAPYGLAASQVLSNTYSITLPDSRVVEDADIGTTFTDAKNGVYPYGFIAKSQICTQTTDGTQTFSITNHYSYTSGYNNIIQDGVTLTNSSQTSDQATELTNFLSYLQDSTLGGSVILSYCYTLQ